MTRTHLRLHPRAQSARREPMHAGVTLWRRVADNLEQEIAAGTYASGDRLPGEVAIAGRLGVNRHTVRRALAELAERGLVRAERGSGTYVEPKRLAYPIGARTRFSEIVGGAGREVGGELIADAEEAAPPDVAERLRIAVGAPVIRLEVLRRADRIPLCRTTTWLPAARLPGAAQIYRGVRSMTATLKHFGIEDYRRHSTRVGAATAEAADAQRLGLTPGALVLVVESVDVDLHGEPLLTSRARFAANRVELLIES